MKSPSALKIIIFVSVGISTVLTAAFHSGLNQVLGSEENQEHYAVAKAIAASIDLHTIEEKGSKSSVKVKKLMVGSNVTSSSFLLGEDALSRLNIADFTQPDIYDFISGTDGKINDKMMLGAHPCSRAFGGDSCQYDALGSAIDFGTGTSCGHLAELSFLLAANASTSNFDNPPASSAMQGESTQQDLSNSHNKKRAYYYPVYLWGENDIFYLSEDEPVPEGAIPVEW